jgi:hypothetical protein
LETDTLKNIIVFGKSQGTIMLADGGGIGVISAIYPDFIKNLSKELNN